MNQHWISDFVSDFALRKRAVAGVVLPVVIAACGGASETARNPTVMAPAVSSSEAETFKAGGGARGGRIYSVINLGPEAGATALLNERGQAAFGSINSDGVSNGFFDGDRLHVLGSLGGSQTWIRGLSNEGVVVGESDDGGRPRSTVRAFAWTAAGGMRALAGADGGQAYAVNDKGQIAGLMRSGANIRAVRWDPDGSLTTLGPRPFSLSQAYAINNDGVSTGFSDVADGGIHATTWDLAGNVNDLGTLGGNAAFSLLINERGQVAGVADGPGDDRAFGFFWSARDGMVPIDVKGGGSRLVAGLNDHGDVVGDTTVAGESAAYLWSRRRGLALLPLGTGIHSDVYDVNNQTDMVGAIRRPADQGGERRAVRWPGLADPIDLNTQLYRTPAGLVLYAAAAINDKGAILVHSNAGLVLLLPGKHGTDAPVLGPIIGLPDTVEVGQQVDLTVGFIDNASDETHTATVIWGDNCPSPPPVLRESGGTGVVSLQHRFCAPGYFPVKVRVTDSGGRTTEVRQDLNLYNHMPTGSGAGR